MRKIASGWIASLDYQKPSNVNKTNIHLTHHDDGNRRFHYFDEPITNERSRPITNLVGVAWFWGGNLDPTVKEETLWNNYCPNEHDKVIMLDYNEFIKDNCRILWDAYFLEPQHEDLIDTLHQGKPLKHSVHIFKEFVPWIVICIYKEKG